MLLLLLLPLLLIQSFACNLLPHQAERLSWHPSILSWCGNNELELSYEWANNTFIRSNRNMFVNDYMTNIRTLRRAIKKVQPWAADAQL
jgi:beta-galactosidase/beta-glucuronidase